MEIERLTVTDVAVFEALARYRFLTPQQMMRLGPTKNIRHLYATLSALARRRPKVIEALDFGALPGRGRLPVVYVLTAAGAQFLAEATREEAASVPSRIRHFSNDYALLGEAWRASSQHRRTLWARQRRDLERSIRSLLAAGTSLIVRPKFPARLRVGAS